jgi:hypothetical protein
MKHILILLSILAITITSCKKGDKGDTGPAGANGSGASFTHYVGENYGGGVVFHVYKGSDGLEHGLIASYTQTTNVKWQTIETFVSATRTWDGAYNTNLMINSPAADYVHSLGSGWYVPAIDELIKLYHNRFEVNKTLSDGGHSLILITDIYWSSTEYGPGNSFQLDFLDSKVYGNFKSALLKVRAVKSF